MRFTFTSLTGDFNIAGGAANIGVVISEVEANNIDLYTVSFTPVGGYGGTIFSDTGSADIHYNITSWQEPINSSSLDSTVVGNGELVQAYLAGTDVTSNLCAPNLTGYLCSVGGNPDPALPLLERYFSPVYSIDVTDTLFANGGQIISVSNQFNVKEVPEIDATSATSALTLLFAGLGLLSNRRRPQADLTA